MGFSAVDTTGPTAAIGPGGYANLQIKLTLPLGSSGQAPSLQSLNIAGPTGFQWTYTNQGTGDPNPQANPNITVSPEVIVQGATTQTVDLYISPVVQYVAQSTGATSTLSLPNNSQLSLTAEYTVNTANGNVTTTDTPQFDPALVLTATGLTQFPADPTPTLPTLGFETYAGTAGVQTSDGNGHIIINGLPAGSIITPATAQLSDVAELFWTIGPPYPNGRPEMTMSIAYSNNNTTANIAFPPERDEAGTTMTFLFQINGSSTQYVTDVAIPTNLHTNPNLLYGGPINPNTTPVMVSPTSSATPNMVTYATNGGTHSQPVDIQTFLNLGYQNVILTDGSTGGVYTISEELNIPSGMILQGADSNVTLNFTMTSVTQGVINFAASHITLEGFNIRFANSSVSFTGLGGSAAAIISDLELLPNVGGVENESNARSRVDLNIENLNIRKPSAEFS